MLSNCDVKVGAETWPRVPEQLQTDPRSVLVLLCPTELLLPPFITARSPADTCGLPLRQDRKTTFRMFCSFAPVGGVPVQLTSLTDSFKIDICLVIIS